IELAGSIGLPDGWARRAYFDISGGRYFDGRRLTLAVRPVWNVSRHLELSAELETSRIALPRRHQSFEANIVLMRFRTAASTRLSAYGLIQHDGATGRTASNVRLRLHLSEGRDAFLVWDETRGLRDGSIDASEFDRRT